MRSYLAAQNVPHSLSNFPEKVSLVGGSLAVLDSSIKKEKKMNGIMLVLLAKFKGSSCFTKFSQTQSLGIAN